MTDTMTNAWFHRLKAAARQLIKLNGGIEACVPILSISKTEIGRWNVATSADLPPVEAVIRLEAECGEPIFTRAMAELHGCTLTNPRDTPADGRCLMRDNAEFQQRNAEFMSGLASAMADRVVTPAEAMRSLRDLEAVERTLPDLKTGLTQIIAQGGGRAGLKVVGEME